MKNIFVKKLLLFILLPICSVLLLYAVFVYFAYYSDKPKYVNGIYVSTTAIIYSRERLNINYCKLLKKATTNDVNSIKQLALLDFSSGVASGYDHGVVIVDLIKLIGEDKFIQSLTTITNEQKRNVKSYIEAGLEYGNNPNLQSKTFKKAFPKTYDFLN
jgi:cell division protein FtsL